MDKIAGTDSTSAEWSHEVFARGYVITDGPLKARKRWGEAGLDHYKLAYHPSLEFRRAERRGAEIVCLGIIFDAMRSNVESQDFLEELVEKLSASEEDFLAALSTSNGRYVLLYRTPSGEHNIVADATGMRTTLYHFGIHVTVSSHINLLGEGAAKDEPRDDRSFLFGFPGRMTPIENVFVLTPNSKLSLTYRRPSRFWPKKTVDPMSLEIAADYIATRLKGAFDWIDRRHDHFLTLTAGLDSRVTLSIVKKRGRYATYYRSDTVDTDEVDRQTTEAFAEQLGIDHTLITREARGEVPKDFLKVVRKNTIKAHIPQMPWAYRNLMIKEPPHGIHIRSNLSEIGRMFYRGRGTDPKTPEDLVTLWTNRAELRTEENAALFADYAEVTDFFEAPVELTSLLYWEHRMGAWHSQVALESDIACETLSLYNCRDLLEAMWSVPNEYQVRSLVLKKIVVSEWPELANFPLNGHKFAPSKAEHREALNKPTAKKQD